MRDKEPSNNIPGRLTGWMREKGSSFFKLGSLKRRLPREFDDFDFKKIELKSLSQYSGWIRLGLLVLAVFLASEMTSRVIGLFVRPTYTPLPRKSGPPPGPSTPADDYEAILRRNIFNVEGKIPDPFDQGRLDCLSQARPTQQRISLLGTIVMSDDRFSVALIQDEGSGQRVGVKKDESFGDGKFLAMKVDRKKLCFQVKASQEFEFIEIPDDSAGLVTAGGPSLGGSDGITPLSETKFEIKQSFLEKNLLNLNEILQTARAVPYVEPGTGQFKGFLIQSIDATSPFAQLGIRQGDVLTAVNDIVLDNAGKGLEAFQRLRGASAVNLKVLRGGSETNISYNVK